MIRGTTATFKFTLPYPVSRLSRVTIEFWQEGYKGTDLYPLPIIKEFTTFSEPADSKQLSVTLTAAETRRFTDKLKARVQLVATTRAIIDTETGEEITPSTRFASRPALITVYPISENMEDQHPEDTAPTDKNGWIILDGQEIVE